MAYVGTSIFAHWAYLDAGIVEEGPGPGRIVLPPPVSDLSFHMGLWREVNDRLGTILDQHEEDELTPEQCVQVAAIVRDHALAHVRPLVPGQITAEVAQEISPVRRSITGSIDAGRLAEYLYALADFLEDAGRRGNAVVIGL